MSTNTSMAIFIVLLALVFFCWVGQIVNLNEINSSDAAGKGLAQAFAVLLALAEWACLAGLLLMGGIHGEIPRWTAVLAVILHPASCAAAIAAGNLMRNGAKGPIAGMMVVPVVAPLAIAAFASWAFFPAIRASIPGVAAGSVAWGVVLILSILPWPSVLQGSREAAVRKTNVQAEEQASEKAALAESRRENLAKLQVLDSDTALWKLMEFTEPKKGVREEAYAAIHNSKRRQSDAEAMSDKGLTLPLLDLPNLDLEATPPIVKAHKAYLLELARRIRRPDAATVQYSWIAKEIDAYLPSIQWMAERHCGCSTEVAALEAEVRSYQDSRKRSECLAALDKAQATEKK